MKIFEIYTVNEEFQLPFYEFKHGDKVEEISQKLLSKNSFTINFPYQKISLPKNFPYQKIFSPQNFLYLGLPLSKNSLSLKTPSLKIPSLKLS